MSTYGMYYALCTISMYWGVHTTVHMVCAQPYANVRSYDMSEVHYCTYDVEQ
jgi:hypothetical protein